MTYLSEEQKSALAKQPDQPIAVVHPDTDEQFVLIRLDAFEKLQGENNYDDSDLNPNDFAATMREVLKDAWDSPDMASYDRYGNT